jgi:hypothetical protein
MEMWLLVIPALLWIASPVIVELVSYFALRHYAPGWELGAFPMAIAYLMVYASLMGWTRSER